MSKTGAELLIESLISAGIKDLFTLSGNQIPFTIRREHWTRH